MVIFSVEYPLEHGDHKLVIVCQTHKLIYVETSYMCPNLDEAFVVSTEALTFYMFTYLHTFPLFA